jgi:hypothetical protein
VDEDGLAWMIASCYFMSGDEDCQLLNDREVGGLGSCVLSN